jgi:hypothetical protein
MAVQPNKIYPLIMLPGIQRDGTQFSSRYYTDGQWVRFYRGLPQKMGGYKQITNTTPNIIRGTFVIPNSPNFNVYVGDANSVKYIQMDGSGTSLSALTDRTPALFPANTNNQWSFDLMYSTINNSSTLIAHATPNATNIDSDTETPVYYGNTYDNSPLIDTGFVASGGIVVLHPFLFIFGNNGSVTYTLANNPTVELGSARVTGLKIVAGISTRGGNSSPAGLLWSLDSLIRVTQVGTTSIEFAFDTVTTESSILSSKSIIEMDSNYYWAGIGKFFQYSGAVQELPNNMNLDYFFNNLNFSQRQKVWATKYPRKGEIWWHYPSGNSTECDRAIIFNTREQKWYDTAISRSSGYFNSTLAYPVWTDNVLDNTNNYPIWLHEIGKDKNVNGTLSAIQSYFKTGNIAWVAFDPNAQQQEIDEWVYLYRLEPDFIQSGDMSFIVSGRKYARSPIVDSDPVIFSPSRVKIDTRKQFREMTLRFESNVVGGYYEMGQVLMVMRTGDARQ